MRRTAFHVVATMTLSLSAAVAAVSAEPSTLLAQATSAAAPTIAPASAPPRLPQGPKSPGDAGPENAVIPQINVPLKKGERKPALVKPLAQKPVDGGVDDGAARCLATSAARRAECGSATASSSAPRSPAAKP